MFDLRYCNWLKIQALQTKIPPIRCWLPRILRRRVYYSDRFPWIKREDEKFETNQSHTVHMKLRILLLCVFLNIVFCSNSQKRFRIHFHLLIFQFTCMDNQRTHQRRDLWKLMKMVVGNRAPSKLIYSTDTCSIIFVTHFSFLLTEDLQHIVFLLRSLYLD